LRDMLLRDAAAMRLHANNDRTHLCMLRLAKKCLQRNQADSFLAAVYSNMRMHARHSEPTPWLGQCDKERISCIFHLKATAWKLYLPTASGGMACARVKVTAWRGNGTPLAFRLQICLATGPIAAFSVEPVPRHCSTPTTCLPCWCSHAAPQNRSTGSRGRRGPHPDAAQHSPAVRPGCLLCIHT
jgi:hypothetical protein